MGTYPAFIKTKTVVQANVPPIIFQLYKTAWVFVLGFLFLIPRSFHPRVIGEPLFVFSWWGFMSAVLWVPAGMTTIASVPMVGMGYQVATACSFSSLLSFIIFTTLASNGSSMKAHSCGHNCTYYLAPFYLILMIAGMLSIGLGGVENGSGLTSWKACHAAPPAVTPLLLVLEGARRPPLILEGDIGSDGTFLSD